MDPIEDIKSESLKNAVIDYAKALNTLRAEFKKSDYYDSQDPAVCSSAEKILEKILPHPNFL